jgi:hypothetical protein
MVLWYGVHIHRWFGFDRLSDDPARQLHDELFALQNPPDCSTGNHPILLT